MVTCSAGASIKLKHFPDYANLALPSHNVAFSKQVSLSQLLEWKKKYTQTSACPAVQRQLLNLALFH